MLYFCVIPASKLNFFYLYSIYGSVYVLHTSLSYLIPVLGPDYRRLRNTVFNYMQNVCSELYVCSILLSKQKCLSAINVRYCTSHLKCFPSRMFQLLYSVKIKKKKKLSIFSPALRRRSLVDDHRCVHRDWPLSVPSPAAPRRLVCCGRGRPGARLCAAPSSAVLSSALRFSTRRRPRHCRASCRAGFPSACTKNSV